MRNRNLAAQTFIRELKKPRRRRQHKPHKFAYLTMKNNARAFFSFWHFEDVLVLSTTWNDLFCSCVDDVGIWWQMFNFVFLCPKRWFQFNWRMVRTHFSRIMTLNNWKSNCRNAKLDFQITFSLPSTSCLLKLPIFKWRFRCSCCHTSETSWYCKVMSNML